MATRTRAKPAARGAAAPRGRGTAARRAEGLARPSRPVARAARVSPGDLDAFANVPVGIAHFALDGRYLYVNPAFCELVGYSARELLARRVQDVTLPEDVPEGQTLQQRLIAGKIAEFNREKRYRCKDGTIRWCSVAVRLVTARHGRPAHFISVIDDISRRKEAENRFEATFNQAAVGIAHTTEDGKIIEVNRKLCEMLGYRPEELIGRATRELTHPEDRDRQDALRLELLSGQRDFFSSEKRYQRKDGGVLWVNRTVTLAHRTATGGRYLIQVIEDISERKRTEQRLARVTRARRVMAECDRVLVHATDETAMLAAMCNIVVESGGYRMAWVGLVTGDPKRPVYPAAHAGFGDDVPMSSPMGWSADGRYRGFMNDAIRSGEPYIARDILGYPAHARRRSRAVQHGFQSSIALPLRHQGAILGALAIYASEPDAFDAEELALLSELTDDIAFGIASLRAVVARREAESALRESERRFRDIFNQAAVGITRVDLNGVLVEANQKFCDMLGYRRDELLGMSVRDITHPDDYGRGAQYRMRLAGGEMRSMAGEKRFVRADGTTIWTRRTMSLASDEQGRPLYVISVVEDITERKKAEEALRANQQLLSATFSQVGVGIFATSLDSRYIEVNEKYCAMLGYGRDELLGMSIRSVNRAEEIDDVLANRARMISGEWRHAHHERQVRRKDGSLIWVAHSTTLVRDENGEPHHFITVAEDISERLRAEEALRESEERFRATFEQAAVGMALRGIDPANPRWLRVNQKLCDILGYTKEELLGLTSIEVTPPEERGISSEYNEKLLRGEITDYSREKRYLRKDGTVIWTNISLTAVRGVDGRPIHVISIIQDITDRKRVEEALRESEEQFHQLANNIPQIFWICDAQQRRMLYVSPAYERVSGQAIARLRADARSWLESVHPEDRERVRAARAAAPAGNYDEVFRVVRPDGSLRWVRDRAFPIHDAEGRIYRIAGIAEDITDMRESEERLLYLAHYDNLTNLPNRVLFYDRLKQALSQAKRNEWVTAVMFLDLDRFKNVNDTLGHGAGDLLLRQVSERLAGCVRSGDTVGRLSGDEFAIVLSNLTGPDDASLVAQKIMTTIARPFNLYGKEVFVSASIGITLFPTDSLDQDTLIQNADTAMYRAKELGRNSFRFYTPEMNARALEKLSLESSLRRALEREEFLLHFQPKASLATGEVIGVEALLRWRHPDLGLVSPVEFMPMLEETGLIIATGEWVIRTACAQIKAWQEAGLPRIPVAVNLSARQFQVKDLGSTISRILEEEGIPHELLELEITEGSLVVNEEEAASTLAYLNSLGVRVAIDDFGTGYSSLSRLKGFPLDALKIDGSFVRDITTDADDAAITRAIITMAHSLGLAVVAEGVETEEQLAFLDANGCDQIQGYYFSMPLGSEECTAFIASARRLSRPARREIPQPQRSQQGVRLQEGLTE